MDKETYNEIFAKLLNHWLNCTLGCDECSICYDYSEIESVLDQYENM